MPHTQTQDAWTHDAADQGPTNSQDIQVPLDYSSVDPSQQVLQGQTTPLQVLFDSLLQTYFSEAGLEAILLTDRDGVPLARSIVVHNVPVGSGTGAKDDVRLVESIPFVIQLLTESAFLSVAAVAGDHASRLSLGKPRHASTLLRGYHVVHVWCLPLVLTMIGDRLSPAFNPAQILALGERLRPLIAQVAERVSHAKD